MTIDIFRYGRKYRNDNYGAHTIGVVIGRLTVWFSYETVVAFQVDGHPAVISENQWGPTTGKHIGWIEDQVRSSRPLKRMKREEFEKCLSNLPILDMMNDIRAAAGLDPAHPSDLGQA